MLSRELDAAVEVAAKAIHGGKGCTCRHGAKGDARLALEAAYPIIRTAVLAEAIGLGDKRVHPWDSEDDRWVEGWNDAIEAVKRLVPTDA